MNAKQAQTSRIRVDHEEDPAPEPERFRGRCARIVRASTLTVKTREYVQAARGLGAREGRIVFRHIVPNCLSPLIVQLVFAYAYAIVAEAALSCIGVGTPRRPPARGTS